MSKSIADQITTADINAALRFRYAQPEWAIMFEVAASTGWAGRYADAVAMNMYPSRGLAVHGFEVKVSRSDWQRELKKPEKAEEISQYCDYWWIATPPGIVKEGELPMGWGLMELHGSTLRIKTKAQERQTTPLDRSFIAAMLRRANQADQATITALVQAGLEERTSYLRATHQSELAQARSQHERFAEKMAEVKEKTGLDFYECLNSERLAHALRLAYRLNLQGDYGGLTAALRDMRHARQGLESAEQMLADALSALAPASAEGGAE